MNLRPNRIRTAGVPAQKPVHKQLAALRLHLRGLGLDFEEEFQFHPTRRWRFDLAIPSLKIGIEYQGHGQTGRNRAGAKGKAEAHVGGHGSLVGLSRDCEKDLAAQLAGWRVLKLTALHFSPRRRVGLKLAAPGEALAALVELARSERGAA